MDRWNAPYAALAGEMLMITLAVEGIDLFKKGHVVITAEQNISSQRRAGVDSGEREFL